ncbi:MULTISPECIES: ATP-binding cassette domain-containing protein [Thauera]|jgi:putative ABC transport system ATP-binding protein|uniref:ATP-binding cassette domain-containing protein n=1 Tax=Thauera TaxID=33057 RepID=UPI0001668C1B|nr:phosphonate-transporting ATPase [Thauera sp. 63]KIN90511.1 ABC transporter family protein [Thauera sp. SWB20]HMM46307.1 ATP-binding cassette domain-containing protein [Candidatus Macondimonas sp.]
MKLSFLGAAREVTGSCFLVEAANARLLVECGMVQGGREAPTRNRKPFEFDPASVANGESRAKALELLTALDVQHRARAMPSQLSGGEQQRVAIACGLVNRPPVILADERTAPLDSERAMAVIRILNDMARKFETAIIVVTHDEKIIPTFKRIYHIRDGVTHGDAGEGRGFE